MQGVSVIIPHQAGEELWKTLLATLPIKERDEVILASSVPPPLDFTPHQNIRWLVCKDSGRATQMNQAATEAKHTLLWFLHADSVPPKTSRQLLIEAMEKKSHALYYFGLRFYDGGWRMRFNELGVWLRCSLFNNPFGDQGFALHRDLFFQLKGFDEKAAYGEDHILTLKAQQQGIPIIRLPASIATSARRYQQQGWWQTVFLFQKLWWRQRSQWLKK